MSIGVRFSALSTRLTNILPTRPARSIAHRLRWSNWRRRHHARAEQAHDARRFNLEIEP
ncbi:hypothetical protein OG767_14315 [Micromonospora sp. NBC_01392]|uniref:hypothetical protein n=1 Tax=Micromonospora sp. NBC_01392 TaxID=2903588 RepID=UPI00324FCF80